MTVRSNKKKQLSRAMEEAAIHNTFNDYGANPELPCEKQNSTCHATDYR